MLSKCVHIKILSFYENFLVFMVWGRSANFSGLHHL